MRKEHREVRKELEALGLQVEDLTVRKRSSHLCISIKAPDGRRKKLFAGCSPSDWRARANLKSMAKRFLRGKRP